MSQFRTISTLLITALFFTLVGELQAQKRANEGLFLNGRVGISTYGGDRDGNSGEDIWSPGLADKFEEGSWSLGLEIGTILSPSFSLSAGYQIGKYLEINNNLPFTSPDVKVFPELSEESSEIRHTVPVLLRWMILPGVTLSPYINLGGNVSFASFTLADGESESKVGFGPSLGAGLDFVVSRHNSIFVEITQHLTFSDEAIDFADPEVEGDDYPYDVLGFWGLGLRHSFKAACGPPEIVSAEAPARIAIGEAAPMTVTISNNACRPVDVSWQFGDGETGTGMALNHMYQTPGTYTVQVTANNSAGSDTATLEVEAFDPCPVEVEIIAINTMPTDPIINETITFTANVRGTEPVTYAWDFGDGTTATGARAGHMYTEPGEYTVTLTCTNCEGENTDTRTITLPVTEFRCADITELNTVFFGRNSVEIDSTAAGLLDENVEVLRECPDLLARLDGYSDRRERRPMQLSENRARAVEQYYIDSGISANRLSARGLGLDPLAGKGVDGQRNRRVDTIIVDSFE